MSITTMDQLVAALNNGQHCSIHKLSRGSISVGDCLSMWQVAGTPGAGPTPSTGAGDVPTSATVGALPFTNSTGTNKSYITSLHFLSTVYTEMALYDRLWANSGLSGLVTVDTTFGPTTALTRPNANGENTELWVEVYTVLNNTNATLTVQYTNSSGVSGRIGTFIKNAALNVTGATYQVTLQSGDTGVQSLTSYYWSGALSTAGDFGFTICRRLTPNLINTFAADHIILNMPVLHNDACIWVIAFVNANTFGVTGQSIHHFTIAQG